MNKEQMMQVLSEIIDESDYKPCSGRQSASAEELRRRLGLLMNTQVFVVGDIVQWKPGMKNRKFPEAGKKAIVTDVFDAPFLSASGDSTGSQYFREPMDIKVGILMPDGDFLEYAMDSRRFEKVAE